MASSKKSSGRQALTPARITAGAFRLIEEEGLDRFSTRKLAQALGCEAMSIYHYFPSKAHLMDALIDRFIDDFVLLPDTAPWRERLRTLIAEWRRNALARPEFFRFFGLHRLNTPGGLRLLDRMLSIFFDAGFDPETAARLFRLTGYYVTGGLFDETAGYARGPSAAEPMDDATIASLYPRIAAVGPYFKAGSYEQTFDLGLSFIFDAYERILAETKGEKAAKP